jgi:hypothetical protein
MSCPFCRPCAKGPGKEQHLRKPDLQCRGHNSSTDPSSRPFRAIKILKLDKIYQLVMVTNPPVNFNNFLRTDFNLPACLPRSEIPQKQPNQPASQQVNKPTAYMYVYHLTNNPPSFPHSHTQHLNSLSIPASRPIRPSTISLPWLNYTKNINKAPPLIVIMALLLVIATSSRTLSHPRPFNSNPSRPPKRSKNQKKARSRTKTPISTIPDRPPRFWGLLVGPVPFF